MSAIESKEPSRGEEQTVSAIWYYAPHLRYIEPSGVIISARTADAADVSVISMALGLVIGNNKVSSQHATVSHVRYLESLL